MLDIISAICIMCTDLASVTLKELADSGMGVPSRVVSFWSELTDRVSCELEPMCMADFLNQPKSPGWFFYCKICGRTRSRT